MKSLYITLTSTWEVRYLHIKEPWGIYKIDIYKEKYHATGSSKESLAYLWNIYLWNHLYITVALSNTLFWLAKCYYLQVPMATGFKT